MLTITYLGNACFEISSSTTTVVIDPYLSENGATKFDVDRYLDDRTPLDAICVTHAAYDHYGDSLSLTNELGIPVITEPGVGHVLEAEGVSSDQIITVVWGQTVSIGEMEIRALEAHHISKTTVEGGLVTGLPVSFLISHRGVSVYHLGDTSIFSDLELFGRLYDPDVAMIGVGQARETNHDQVDRNIAELSIDEAVLASRWIDPGVVIPMHYLPEEKEAFLQAMRSSTNTVPVNSMDPGDEYEVG